MLSDSKENTLNLGAIEEQKFLKQKEKNKFNTGVWKLHSIKQELKPWKTCLIEVSSVTDLDAVEETHPDNGGT